MALVHLGKVGTLLIKDPEPGHLCANATGIAFVGLTFLDACHEAGVKRLASYSVEAMQMLPSCRMGLETLHGA